MGVSFHHTQKMARVAKVARVKGLKWLHEPESQRHSNGSMLFEMRITILVVLHGPGISVKNQCLMVHLCSFVLKFFVCMSICWHVNTCQHHKSNVYIFRCKAI